MLKGRALKYDSTISKKAILIDPQRDIARYQKIATKNDLRIIAVAEIHISDLPASIS